MGRVQRTKPSSPLPTVADDGRRDGDGVTGNGDVNGERNLSVSNLENEVRLSIESEGYGEVKVECEKALNAIRRGNHTKAIKLMKELCGKYENPEYLALVYRVQGTVLVKAATTIDDPTAKQRYLKNAIESAKKAAKLSPGSVEFAHFYANLIYETASDGKDYEDSVRECERALAIKNPIDPGKESLQDESQQKISAADARIVNVQNELRALLHKANLQRTPSHDIKKANKTDKERKKGTGPQTGERRKSGKVKKNTSSDERKEAVLSFWKSMSSDLKKGLFEINISDIKSHFKSLNDGLAYEVINEALSFGVDNNSLRFWMCCRCSEKFADPELHNHHVLHAHTQSLSLELQAVLPPTVDSEWEKMLLTCPWKALDRRKSVVRMIQLESYSQNIPEFINSDCSDDTWKSWCEEKQYDDSCNGTGVGRETHSKTLDCVPMECDQSEGCKIYPNPDSWPLSDDSDRMKLLEKIKGLFQLLIKRKCLAASHLTKVIDFAVLELHPQLLNYGLEQSPICICFLGATELKKVSMFLQELSHSCKVKKGMEELNGVTQVSELAEKIVIDKDGSSLLLDELSLPCEDNISSEKRLAVDDDSLLSWIFSGPTSQEQLAFWTRSQEEKVHQGVELLDTLGKEFAHLQSLCERKMEHISYEEAVQLVEDLCLEERKRRENSTVFVRQSYESVLRKRRHDISESDSEVTPVNKFEVEVLTNVLKEADAFTASQLGYELESGEDDWRVNDSLRQLNDCIEDGIQKQREHLSVELCKIDARILRNVSGIKQLEAKIGPLCAHDFGLIVVPLVKSYLRAHIENLAEKDATEKSDAAREAFLVELALDSKKGTGDISKNSNDKLKDKRKNKQHRKSKVSKGTGTGDLHVSSHDNVSKASSTPPEIDEQPSYSDAETGAVLHQQEDEARRRKMELQAEERKLQETLEYQRRIEDEAKQRHLAEQLKSSSRVTPTGNPVDDEWEPSTLEPIKQNNGVLSPPEDGLCNAKDGFPERTDTSSGDNGAVPLRLLQAEDDDDEKRFQADPSNIQDVIINPDQQNVELEVKEVGEIGKSQNAQKSFSSQASGFGFEMGKDRHLDGSDGSRGIGSTLGGQDEVQDASVDLPSESAIPSTVDSPASVSSTKGKHKGTNGQESTPSSPPSQSVYNSTDSHNEVGVGSSVPSGDAIISELRSMQAIIAQIPTMVATTVTEEGREIKAAIGKSMEKMLKETSALVASVVPSVIPIIEKIVSTAITEAFQRGVADKSVNQLEKSVNSKLEGIIARQIQTQFQTSGKQVLQDAHHSASSMTQRLNGELADGRRKLVAPALAGANFEWVNPLVTQFSNRPIGSFHDKMEAPLDPTKELSRLVYEQKYEEAFTAALQRNDVQIVSWLCSQVDLQGLLIQDPLPLSESVLLSLLQQLAFDIGNDTSKKLKWMIDIVVAIYICK